jgi:hypothetical protein
MDDYGSKDKVYTKAEHLTPPIITYLLRKALLYLILSNLWAMKQLSKVYGFHYEATVSDRVEWDWEVREKIPRYHAQVEKVD